MKFIKLFFGTISAAFTLFSVLLFRTNLCFSGGTNYVFFVGKSASTCKIVHAENPSALALILNDVRGESATFYNFNVDDFLLSVNGKILFTETLSDSVNYYCSADLPYSVCLYGETVNLHVCIKADKTIVGSPIIFGGY